MAGRPPKIHRFPMLIQSAVRALRSGADLHQMGEGMLAIANMHIIPRLFLLASGSTDIQVTKFYLAN